MSGTTGLQTELLYSLATPVTKNTYTTQALIGPVAASAPVPHIAGGFFSDEPNPLGRSLYLQAFGLIGTTTGPPTFWPELGLDTTPGTLANGIPIYASISQTASVIAQWNMQAWITCQAFGETAMTLQVNGTWSQATVATGGAANAGALSSQFGATITALVPSTTYYIELFGTWGTSNVLNTTTIQQMTLWGLN
jgi:hypothetical protein